MQTRRWLAQEASNSETLIVKTYFSATNKAETPTCNQSFHDYTAEENISRFNTFTAKIWIPFQEVFLVALEFLRVFQNLNPAPQGNLVATRPATHHNLQLLPQSLPHFKQFNAIFQVPKISKTVTFITFETDIVMEHEKWRSSSLLMHLFIGSGLRSSESSKG